jgi:hypothetical protein
MDLKYSPPQYPSLLKQRRGSSFIYIIEYQYLTKVSSLFPPTGGERGIRGGEYM